MALDLQTQAMLDGAKEQGAPALCELPVPQAREMLLAMTLMMDAPKTEVAKSEQRTIPGPRGDIPIRLYWPDEHGSQNPKPILMQFHGGGWTLGDLDTHENICRFYCKNTDVIVISVDYRLAPEHKFPAGVEDCYAATCWAAQHAAEIGGDADRIAVTGDSAGGNLSAVICQMAKSKGGPKIAFQALVYPAVDLRDEAANLYPSRDAFAEGYFLTRQDIDWLGGMYFNPGDDKRDVRVSPLLAEDLSDLPPALVITAGFDPLRDEGKVYADRLKEAGVPVDYHCFETTIHGFLSFSGAVDAGKDGLALVATSLAKALH